MRVAVNILKLKRPTAFALILAVILGTDPENKYWISRTKFAELYRRIVLFNVATNMVAFNGSAYGTARS